MTESASLLFPCCCSASKANAQEAQPSSTALKQAFVSFAFSVVVGFGIALAAYTLTHGSIEWAATAGGATTLFIGAPLYVALRCLLGPKTDAPKGANAEEHTLPPKWEGCVIQELRTYGGDMPAERKEQIVPELSEKGDRLTLSFTKHPTFNVSICAQSIYESGATVLVNAANSHLGGGDGIDGEIHDKGGSEYTNEHFALRDVYNKKYVSGHAAIIGSGALKKEGFQKVIVVAGPIGRTDVPSEEQESALYSCYYNSLLLAQLHRHKSFASPAISTGRFGFSKERAAEISLKAIADFIENHPDSPLKTIAIHFYKTETTFAVAYQKALAPPKAIEE